MCSFIFWFLENDLLWFNEVGCDGVCCSFDVGKNIGFLNNLIIWLYLLYCFNVGFKILFLFFGIFFKLVFFSGMIDLGGKIRFIFI